MSVILDFAAARRARGLPVAGPHLTMNCIRHSERLPLPTEVRRDLRAWRCFEAKIGQREAAKKACVTVGAWAAAERGRAVDSETVGRILSVWQSAGH